VRKGFGWAAVNARGDTLADFDTNGAAWRYVDKLERRQLWARRETADWTGTGVYHDASKGKSA
jgi:hypothetical protein